MSKSEILAKAYLEALFFTETGDTDQPGADAELTPFYKAKSWIECRNFYGAYGKILDDAGVNPVQAGHDLWFTRNGHGAGFWDRPEVYGEALAQELTRVANAMGSSDPEFECDEAPVELAGD